VIAHSARASVLRWLPSLTLGAGVVLASCTTFPANGPRMVPVETGRTGVPVGSVEGGSGRRRLPRAEAENHATYGLQVAAASLGANYVRVESFTWNAVGSRGYRGSAHGTAFRCVIPEPSRVTLDCTREGGLSTCVVTRREE
jgi:hypothetical protein